MKTIKQVINMEGQDRAQRVAKHGTTEVIKDDGDFFFTTNQGGAHGYYTPEEIDTLRERW